jgi:hypothetical protein
MKWIYHIILIAIGLFFTVLFGFDGVYVGFIASETELAQYPWSTELGWSYFNKTNYMIKGTLMAAFDYIYRD